MAGKTHGGRRPGAGRKPGSATKRTRAVADQLAEEGVMPLEIITEVMRKVWEEANVGGRLNLGKAMQAVALAEKAAPYMHAKLSSVAAEHSGPDGGAIQTDGSLRIEFVAATKGDGNEG